MSNSKFTKARLCAAAAILALVIVPAPILPPDRLAEAVESWLGISWMAAYFAVGMALQACFYFLVGILASFAVPPAPTPRGRLLQIALVPLIVVGMAISIRAAKMGHLPIWMNAVVPVIACLLGAALGLGIFYKVAKIVVLVVAGLAALVLWKFLGSPSTELNLATKAHLERLVAVAPNFPSGEPRFGALLQTAFSPLPEDQRVPSETENDRGAILAWGIAVGDEQLAQFAGLDSKSELVQRAAALREGVALRGRSDWARHYATSAALAILAHPIISDAIGQMKEQLDAFPRGSGFSFGDFAANRAGIRFASTATQSVAAAKAMQDRLQADFVLDDFFPPASDLPEDIPAQQLHGDFGGVGGPRYRALVNEIESRLDQCSAISTKSGFKTN